MTSLIEINEYQARKILHLVLHIRLIKAKYE
jgi:hypothetical protein